MTSPWIACAAIVLASLVSPGVRAQDTHLSIAPDPARAAAYFDEAHALSDRDAGALWGVRLYGPMLFVDPATRRVVANQADGEGRLAPDGRVFVGALPNDVPIANTAVEWAGVRWTMVMWPLPEDATRRAGLMAHELFHRIQNAVGLRAASPSNAHLDTLEGRYLMQLEWRALRVALAARGAGRRAAVEDALAFRARRRALFPVAESEERALELNEGMAEYTGRTLAARSRSERIVGAEQALEDAAAKPSFTRSFAYGSGPAYGLLLDESGARWRSHLDARSDLGVLLAAALRIRLAAAPAAGIERRAQRYAGAELLASETRRDAARRERSARNRARFVDGPVLSIPLGKMNISFDPNELEPLGDLGTVYPTARIADAWGVLTVTNGALLSADWSRVCVTAPTDSTTAPLHGEGWTLELAPGWRVVPGTRPGDLALAPK